MDSWKLSSFMPRKRRAQEAREGLEWGLDEGLMLVRELRLRCWSRAGPFESPREGSCIRRGGEGQAGIGLLTEGGVVRSVARSSVRGPVVP